MVELVFLVGICWALARGFDATRTAVKAHTAAARARTPDPHKRRVARQAMAGWWLGETLHGFPHTRHGLGAGWAEHRHATEQYRRDAAQRDADNAQQRAGWRAETAAHLHRLEIIAQQIKSGPPMSDQLRAAVRHADARLGGAQPAPAAPAPAPAQPKTARPPAAGGTDPDLDWGHPKWSAGGTWQATDENARKWAEDERATGGSTVAATGDTNYTQVIETCDRAVATAEHAVSEADLAALTGMADQLGGMLRGDSETMGCAADLAAAAAKVEAANRELIEAATALRARTERAYGQYKEAADSSDAAPPEPQFVEE